MSHAKNLTVGLVQTQKPALEAKNIVKRFTHSGDLITALDGIDLTVNDGDFVCLVGPSGCGKSTFLRIVAGLEKQDSGTILLNGSPITNTAPNRVMVFQEGGLFPWLSVIDNVEFGLKMNGIKKEERHKIAMRYLTMMQLEKFADSHPHQLSTGMKQRIAIARAMAMDPKILLMDEPFAALDPQTRDTLLLELQLIWEKTKKTILFVTHNVDESVILGNKVAIFKKRPSKIKKEVTVDYPRPRRGDDENIAEYKRQIIAELKNEVRE